MNKQLRRLGIGLIACYVILFAQLNWLQVVKADDYNKDPRNDREVVRDFTRPRGSILTADGVVIAQSVPSNDRYKLLRSYPAGDLFVGDFDGSVAHGPLHQQLLIDDGGDDLLAYGSNAFGVVGQLDSLRLAGEQLLVNLRGQHRPIAHHRHHLVHHERGVSGRSGGYGGVLS